MKILIVFLIFLSCLCFAEVEVMSSSKVFDAAEDLYKSRKYDEAKILYLEAAKAGHINSYFALGYRYSDNKNEKLYYLQKSAENGHSKGMYEFLDFVFFRSDSFIFSNPKLSMEVYQKGKSSNPSIKIYKEEEKIKTISKCLEANSIDVNSFIDKYNVDSNDSPWRWARIISLEKNNPELVFGLVCLGGSVPNEKKHAIRDYYDLWKKNISKEFHGCDYAASKWTLAMCSRKKIY